MKRFFPNHKFWLLKWANEINGNLDRVLEVLSDPNRDALTEYFERASPEWRELPERTRYMEVEFTRIGLGFEERILRGAGCHYFVESEELAEFLPSLSHQYRAGFISYLLGKEDWKCGVIYIHGRRARTILWGVTRDTSGDAIYVDEVIRGKSNVVGWSESLAGPIKNAKEPIRVALGLAYYAMQYAGAMTDGLPEFVQHPAHFKGRSCVGVRVVKDIMNPNPNGPKFIMGHTRYLVHERFINKRYQWVKVKPYHTNAKVKTVRDVR